MVRAEAARIPWGASARFSDADRDRGLMSYASDVVDSYRRAPSYVDRILRGAKVAELPVQQPTRYELTINVKTAKALAVIIPRACLQSLTK